jgi:two-component system chemotaxis sensor kinase CheA
VRNDDDIALFQEEAAELIEALESGLLELERGRSEDVINRVFRAIHTIKGGAGLVGLDELAYFAHDVEHLMQHVRAGDIEPEEDVIAVLLGATDLVRMFVAENIPEESARRPILRGLHEALKRRGLKPPKPLELPGRSVPAPASAPAGTTASSSGSVASPPSSVIPASTRPKAGDGFDVPVYSVIPPEGTPDAARAKWGFLFKTGTLPPIADDSSGKPSTPPGGEPQFDALVPSYATSDAPRAATPPPAPGSSGGTLAAPTYASAEQGPVHPGPAHHGAGGRAGGEPQRADERRPAEVHEPRGEAGAATVRVPLEKLDRLVNLVGELVIAQATVAQLLSQIDTARVPALVESVGVMERHCRELQERVLGVRMLPIETVFGRFQRLARDLGASCGKRLELTLEGGETELDKTVLESMTDPLTHLVRNAIDHGLETPAERVAAGKPELGHLKISAAQKSGTVRIDVSDDGRGLDRDRIFAKAVKQGLIDRGEPIDDASVYALVFRPGFSTRDEVSSLSGRGVGMDVVKSTVERLKGSVGILTEPGRGTTFRITLPLTMAILDGLALEMGGQVYVLPLVAVIESVRVGRQQIRRVANRQEAVEVRGELHPLVRLSDVFDTRGQNDDVTRGIVVIVDDGARRYALLVDDVVGQYQVVVKSLETNYGRVQGLSGATILGDGRVALILDPLTLADLARLHARAGAPADAAE